MDTFSAASSILSLLESVSSVIHSLVKLADGEEQSYQMRRWITKADVCKYLLYGLGNQFTQSAWAPSKDITDVKKSCLLLCGDAFKTLSDRLAKMEDSKLKAFKSAPQVERALDDGLAAIRMLREIIDQLSIVQWRPLAVV
ncbi:hypothetical protein EV356DRAFT_496560 [Viridothelium virens]|uniref:Uncharacterized protein n=1 Tax=Viridothelium virens TaxID=1048519 RepID=A0A6A6GTT9_VIRVR|nr:hypothetical protein EV356DRAFT_496560 [Viridothelium virens]